MQHSLVTIPSSDTNEEYVLLIGGMNQDLSKDFYHPLDTVFKFNGTWSPFGLLNKPRYDHSSIYWNGAVYVIGGRPGKAWSDAWGEPNPSEPNPFLIQYFNFSFTPIYEFKEDVPHRIKMEIWNIKDSPDQFESTENWPELFDWKNPHLFIVPDSFFPDY